jgi:hypothetical protein
LLQGAVDLTTLVCEQNLGIGKWEKRLRVVYVNLTLLFFFSFFTTPLSIISALQPLKQVRHRSFKSCTRLLTHRAATRNRPRCLPT